MSVIYFNRILQMAALFSILIADAYDHTICASLITTRMSMKICHLWLMTDAFTNVITLNIPNTHT